jgi:hypothetical protein
MKDTKDGKTRFPECHEHYAPAPVFARNYLRQALYDMSDVEFKQVQADLLFVWREVMKRIEADTGLPFWEYIVEAVSEMDCFNDAVVGEDGETAKFRDHDKLEAL